ncbi:hypothetical protein ES707_03439 [subsurface metagenome]
MYFETEVKNSKELVAFIQEKFEGHEIDEDITRSNPFERICEIIVTHSEKLGIEIEREYYCKDFMAEYSNFYSKLFKRITSNCHRIHFWKNHKENSDNYLGYCVLRPLNFSGKKGVRLGKIGRTMIKYNPLQGEYPLLCSAKEEINLDGEKFEVNATPFIQQDTQVGVCAQASIWMASRYFHGRYKFREYYMDEITEMATRYKARGSLVPTTGLYEEQMMECFVQMGYIPLFYPIEEWEDYPESIIYRYMESGIPVILSVKLIDSITRKEGRHAVMVMGHNFNPKHFKNNQFGSPLPYYTPLSWIEYFIIQDDAIGPYIPLFIRKEDTLESFKGIKEKINYFVYPNVESILVPLPAGVNLRGEVAEIKAFDLIMNNKVIKDAIQSLSNDPNIKIKKIFQIFKKALDDKKIVLRTYLKPSNEYKLYLKNKGPILPLRKLYRSIHMSKYIWIVEISTTSLFSKEKEEGRSMLGEIIFDASDTSYSEAFLIIHLPFICIIREPHNEKWTIKTAITDETSSLLEDSIYGHYLFAKG